MSLLMIRTTSGSYSLAKMPPGNGPILWRKVTSVPPLASSRRVPTSTSMKDSMVRDVHRSASLNSKVSTTMSAVLPATFSFDRVSESFFGDLL